MKILLSLVIISAVIPLVVSLGKWTQLLNANTPPIGREAGALGVVNDVVYFFGGMRHCDGTGMVCSGLDPCNNTFFNQMDSYDLGSNMWSVNVVTSGTVPDPRSFMAYTTDQDRNTLLVYGGATFQGGSVASCNNVFFDGLWEFNTSSLTWRRLDSPSDPNSPKARVSSSIVTYGHLVYLFGGLKTPGIPKNDLLTFNYTTGLWSPVIVSSGPLPAGRYHQRMLLDTSELGHNNDRLIVVWGDNFLAPSLPPPVYINDIWTFDLINKNWSLIDSGNQEALYHPIAGHYRKVLYVAYGDSRPKPYNVESVSNGNDTGLEVDPECFDEVTGFESTPTNLHYAMNVKDATLVPGVSRALQSINVAASLGNSKMTAHAPYADQYIYATGGFNFYCPKYVPIGSRTTVTTYLTNVYVTDLSKYDVYINGP